MKSPCTSQPPCFSNSAATAESTPPDSPTMTRSPPRVAGGAEVLMRAILRDAEGLDTHGGAHIKVRNGRQLAAHSREVVLDTAHDERAAQLSHALLQLRA